MNVFVYVFFCMYAYVLQASKPSLQICPVSEEELEDGCDAGEEDDEECLIETRSSAKPKPAIQETDSSHHQCAAAATTRGRGKGGGEEKEDFCAPNPDKPKTIGEETEIDDGRCADVVYGKELEADIFATTACNELDAAESSIQMEDKMVVDEVTVENKDEDEEEEEDNEEAFYAQVARTAAIGLQSIKSPQNESASNDAGGGESEMEEKGEHCGAVCDSEVLSAVDATPKAISAGHPRLIMARPASPATVPLDRHSQRHLEDFCLTNLSGSQGLSPSQNSQNSHLPRGCVRLCLCIMCLCVFGVCVSAMCVRAVVCACVRACNRACVRA